MSNEDHERLKNVGREYEEQLNTMAGEAIIRVLNLKVKANGRVDTSQGDKTPLGLARTMAHLLTEEGATKNT